MMFQDVVGAPMFSEVANAQDVGFETKEEVPFILEDGLWSTAEYPVENAAAPESLRPSTICPTCLLSLK